MNAIITSPSSEHQSIAPYLFIKATHFSICSDISEALDFGRSFFAVDITEMKSPSNLSRFRCAQSAPAPMHRKQSQRNPFKEKKL